MCEKSRYCSPRGDSTTRYILVGNIRRCGVFFTPDLMYFFFWQQVSYTFNLKYVQRYYIIRHIFAVIESRGLQLAPE